MAYQQYLVDRHCWGQNRLQRNQSLKLPEKRLLRKKEKIILKRIKKAEELNQVS